MEDELVRSDHHLSVMHENNRCRRKPCFASVWIKFRGLDSPQESSHVALGCLNVCQNVQALLRIDTRDSVTSVPDEVSYDERNHVGNLQKVTLKSQCHWRFWSCDGIACFRDVHVKNGFTVDLSEGRLGSQSGNKPVG